ncbi:MAG: DEAD/DEAH box helicase [Planctomycetota bacterium]
MDLTNELKPLFDSRARKRGEVYFLGGAVEGVRVERNTIQAGVKGKNLYAVSMRVYDDHAPEFSCTCPFYREWRENCKHLWALVLKVDSMTAEGTLSYGALFGGGNGKRAVCDWTGLKQAVAPRETPDEADGFHPFYLLDRMLTVRRRQLTFVICERFGKKNGAWGRQRDFTGVRGDGVAISPVDRQILTVLMGQAQVAGGRFSTAGYAVAPDLYAYLVPLLAATCRTGLTDGAVDRPLAIDLDRERGFTVVVEPAGSGYAVRGLWRIGDREAGRDEIDLVAAAGGEVWVLRADQLVRGRGPDEALRWEELLHREGPVALKGGEIEPLINHMNRHQAVMPAVRLPEQFLFPEEPIHTIQPLIYLTCTHNTFWAEPAFMLNGAYEFSAREATAWHIDVKRRVRVCRDRSREAEYLGRLAVAGLEHGGDWYHCRPEDVAEVIARLDAGGWAVYGEDRKARLRPLKQSSLRIRTGINWFEIEGGLTWADAAVPVARVAEALRKGNRFVSLGGGEMGVLPGDWLTRYAEVFKFAETGTAGEETFRFRRDRVGVLAPLVDGGLVESDAEFRAIGGLAGRGALVPAAPPPGFKGELRGYQQLGLAWFEFLDAQRLGGCLADDMGLGKTVQLLAFLAWKRQAQGRLHALIVVPAAIIFNWVNEARRFTPDLRVLQFWGPERRRAWAHRAGSDIILTSYATMVRDAATLAAEPFDLVIFDEAQQLKNPWAQRTRAARRINARLKLSLTGTPLENHLGDLWSQFSVLNPGQLGTLPRFKEEFMETTEGLAALRRIVGPFILRRTKKEVLADLPDKVEEVLYAEMEPEQRQFYEEMRDAVRARILGMVQAKGVQGARMNILEGLLRLRQICCHPNLVDRRRTADSGKFALFKEMAEELIDEKHKALVFSQFTGMLGIIRAWLDERGIPYAYLDGGTRDREAQVAMFQERADVPLFLISLRAGGVGLNLTAADYVFLYDPWWNPAVESQAIDRAHRIGQKNTVFTYRMIARGSIEEKVMDLQARKRGMLESIITAPESVLGALTAEDIEYLFS